jgi:hypothetical protein
VKYTDQQLVEQTNQRKIFKLLSRHEDHDVATLISSMCKVGFMREMAPIVMKVEGVDRCVVLEWGYYWPEQTKIDVDTDR